MSSKLPTIVVRSEVLSSWLTVSGHSQSQLARSLGVSRGRISQLLSSGKEPSAHLMAKLLTVTGLPFERLFRIVRQDQQANGYGDRAKARSRSKREALAAV